MASILKRGDGYQIKWRDPDGQQRARKAPDFATAQRIRRDVERTVAEGRRWEPADARPLPDLDELTRDYIRHCARVGLAPRTVALYAERLDVFLRFLRQREGNRRRLTAAMLSRASLTEFYDWLLSTPKTAGTRTTQKLRKRSTLRKILLDVEVFWEWAFNHDEQWPDLVPRPRRLSADLPRELPTETHAPTWAEMDACVHAATGWHRRVAVFMRYTGLRVDQVMRLDWSDLDLDAGELHVRPALGKTAQERRGRRIPISKHLVAELGGWGRREGPVIVVDRSKVEDRTFRGRDLARAWKRAGVRAHVWAGHPTHALRKGWESGLLALGARWDAVEHLVGHALPGSSDPYVDRKLALPLAEVVALVPEIGPVVLRMSEREPIAIASADRATVDPGQDSGRGRQKGSRSQDVP